MTGKLIVASSRLPVTMTKSEGRWQVKPSTGGLVTALGAVREKRKFLWLGWPGADVALGDRREVSKQLAKAGTSAVFIDSEHLEGFYEGFSNDTLWPLFHDLTERVSFVPRHWESYRVVNQMYADAIARAARPGDTIWVHDYQLCLVPQMLRAKGLGCTIGYFLHIPFPTASGYRTLPVAEEILKGMLGADLIGFHAYEYVSNFRSAALRILGMDSDAKYIPLQSRRVHLEVLPIGIEPKEVRELAASVDAKREVTELTHAYVGKKLIVGVDRLDYTKGIPQKLLGFEELLRRHPQYRDKVVLVQVAAPSRTGVEEYQQLKREVDELVGRINGQYSTPSYTPVVYINQPVQRSRLAGLYRAADVGLVTPVRDGMNLVALEYVAARHGLGGTLILSEFCGAAHCLPGAKLVNPFNMAQVAESLHEALAGRVPNLEAFGHMETFVNRNTSTRWAEANLELLEELRGDQSVSVKLLDMNETSIADLARRAKRPLVVLDYDGTLRSYVINPQDAVPDRRILRVIERLSELSNVYVVSGRDGETLEKWLGHLNIGLVCEHGLAMKLPGGDWQGSVKVNIAGLNRLVRPLFEEYVRRTPGSSIETKRAALAWHSRAADPEYAQFQSNELHAQLEDLLKKRPYRVLKGNRVIEVRHELVTKGSAMERILEEHPRTDFLFCAGDDRTDEDMMRAIPQRYISKSVRCWVGAVNANAEYWRESNSKLLSELEKLIVLLEREPSPVASKSASAQTKTVKKAAAKKVSTKGTTKKAATQSRGAASKKTSKQVTKKTKARSAVSHKKTSPRSKR